MKHNRLDYQLIQDPSGKIGADEPVFLLRGKDALAPDCVRHWAKMIQEVDDPRPETQAMIQSVLRWADEMEAWQKINGAKVPDVDEDQLVS